MRNQSQTPLAVSVPTYPASEKVYVPGRLHPYIRVAMRKIHLTDPAYPAYYAYDTSGVYTDPGVSVDIRQGLPRLREAWIAARGDTERHYELLHKDKEIRLLGAPGAHKTSAIRLTWMLLQQ